LIGRRADQCSTIPWTDCAHPRQETIANSCGLLSLEVLDYRLHGLERIKFKSGGNHRLHRFTQIKFKNLRLSASGLARSETAKPGFERELLLDFNPKSICEICGSIEFEVSSEFDFDTKKGGDNTIARDYI